MAPASTLSQTYAVGRGQRKNGNRTFRKGNSPSSCLHVSLSAKARIQSAVSTAQKGPLEHVPYKDKMLDERNLVRHEHFRPPNNLSLPCTAPGTPHGPLPQSTHSLSLPMLQDPNPMESSTVTSPALNTTSRRPQSPTTSNTPSKHGVVERALPFNLETPANPSVQPTAPQQPHPILPVLQTPSTCATVEVTDLSTLYGFFNKRTIPIFRKICEHWNLRPVQPKAVYVAQCCLYVIQKLEAGEVMRDVVVGNPYALQFDSYLESGKQDDSTLPVVK